jgi:hypothetical protein
LLHPGCNLGADAYFQRVRGFPLLQLLFVAAVFLAAGVPVWSLTRPAAEAVLTAPAGRISASSDTAAPAAEPLTIEAAFAPAPADFQIQCDGQTVLEGQGPARQFTGNWKNVVPKEGVDLVVRADWLPENGGAPAGPAAARITVRSLGAVKVEKSFWTGPGESLAEIVTVPGGQAPSSGTP